MEETMEFVQSALASAQKANMLAEVVYTALNSMKENANLTIEEALQAGLNEWDV